MRFENRIPRIPQGNRDLGMVLKGEIDGKWNLNKVNVESRNTSTAICQNGEQCDLVMLIIEFRGDALQYEVLLFYSYSSRRSRTGLLHVRSICLETPRYVLGTLLHRTCAPSYYYLHLPFSIEVR